MLFLLANVEAAAAILGVELQAPIPPTKSRAMGSTAGLPGQKSGKRAFRPKLQEGAEQGLGFQAEAATPVKKIAVKKNGPASRGGVQTSVTAEPVVQGVPEVRVPNIFCLLASPGKVGLFD